MIGKKDREKIKELILEDIVESYKIWQVRQETEPCREPNLTTTKILDYLLRRSGCPDSLKWSERRIQRSTIENALKCLKRENKISSSWGAGEYGKEVRCWEPTGL